MNKSESKYFSTAAKMDEAFLKLLGDKDFAYITVKEICALAGVNRSTFYLHYETMADLLSESVEHMNKQFLEYVSCDKEGFADKLYTCPLEELYLVTPEYLIPYLNYVKEHKRLFKTSIEKADVLRLDDSYSALLKHILMPVLDRYQVSQAKRKFMMAFYINGLIAIINEWISDDCMEPIDDIIAVMQDCTHRWYKREQNK